MPKISEFFGIEIVFNYRGEHNPPHFHAAMQVVKAFFQYPPRVFAWGFNSTSHFAGHRMGGPTFD
jgi:hypothetical protein